MSQNNKTIAVKVWDFPTRLFHWSLLLLVIACWWTSTEDGDMDWHMRCGYAVLALLLFRLMWGIWGSSSARFSDFVSSPRAVFAYFSTLKNAPSVSHLGHNPAGGWMVLALLGVSLLTALSGLFANDDMMSAGPLARHVSEHLSDTATTWHERLFYSLLALVMLHLAAIVFYLLVKKENLVRPMLTGLKYLPRDKPLPALQMRGIWLALLLLGVAATSVWILTKLA